MSLNVNIINIFKTKPRWQAEGIVAHSDNLPERHAYSPKVGMVFTARVVPDNSGPFDVKKWVKDPATNKFGKPIDLQTPLRHFHKVYFNVDQSIRSAANPTGVLEPIDPETNADIITYPPNFLQTFTNTPFYHVDSNMLIARPILIDPRDVIKGGELERNLPLAITFTMELYTTEDGELRMLERGYWSDGYSGSYCCT